ncbi:hypothetical protein TNCV_2371821 [Trichonephila clavipes]|nr:hypothetical protein TNCV_2371821 [Trichonephila clavipes]
MVVYVTGSKIATLLQPDKESAIVRTDADLDASCLTTWHRVIKHPDGLLRYGSLRCKFAAIIGAGHQHSVVNAVSSHPIPECSIGERSGNLAGQGSV